jgi:glycosyltransferase involved in cell wall biosynthesis
MERIAVIIPAYQSAGTIRTTLTTLFQQTRLPDEVIVVNDGSTDALRDALQPWIEKITYIEQQQQGAPVARNVGFQASTAEYIVFLDADIRLEATMLDRLADALNDHPEAAFAYPDFRFGWKHFHLAPYSYERLRQMNYIHTSAMIRRTAFPGFDPALRKFQDWDLWLTIAERGGHGVWVNQLLYTVTQRKHGMSSWLPKFVYRLPFIGRGIGNATIQSYREAEAIIRKKHGLN